MIELNKVEAEFLLKLVRGEKLGMADREQDKARQKVRRLGFAEVVMNPRRWSLTAKGWAYYNRYYQ